MEYFIICLLIKFFHLNNNFINLAINFLISCKLKMVKIEKNSETILCEDNKILSQISV